jgi:type IV secretory pathway TrbD component
VNEREWWRRRQADEAWQRQLREDYDMDNQRPAAPAVSLPATRPADPIVSLPTKSATWQRTYPSVPSSPPQVLGPTHSWTRRTANDYQIGNRVFTSLQRPKLLRGGEWQLSIANNLMAAGLGTMAFVTWNWHLVLGAAFFVWPVQWLIRMVGHHDPQWWAIYFRTRKRPLIREPHGYPSDTPAPLPRILPKLPKFVA